MKVNDSRDSIEEIVILDSSSSPPFSSSSFLVCRSFRDIGETQLTARISHRVHVDTYVCTVYNLRGGTGEFFISRACDDTHMVS